MNKEMDTTEKETVLGYAIERTGNPQTPYILHGARGATYGLIRYNEVINGETKVGTSTKMYAVNTNRYCNIVALKSNSTFTDKGGTLRALTYGAEE